jgi:hypothetical protein
MTSTRRKRRLFAAALAALCASARPVAADGGERWRLGAELSLIVRDAPHETLSVTSPALHADYALTRDFGVGADWGFLLVTDAPRHESALWVTGSGDPLLKAWWTPNAQLYLYAGVTAPLAWLSYDVEKRALMRLAYAHASASRGLWDPWLWAPEQASLVLGARFAQALGDDVWLRLEGGAAGSLSVSQVTRDLGDGYAQLSAAVETHTGPLDLGLRLQQVLMTSSSDAAQFSLGPYAALHMGRWTASARGVFNVDPPLGFLGGGLHTWGVLWSLRGSL